MTKNHECPKWILDKFTKEVVLQLMHEIRDVFENIKEWTYCDYQQIESTCGWETAFINTCKKYEFTDVIDYYNKLDWYDSDIFDGCIGTLILKYQILKDNSETYWSK